MLGFGDHHVEANDPGAQGCDPPVNRCKRLGHDPQSLCRIAGSAELLTVALPGPLLLEESADLGQREAGVIAQPSDEAESLEVVGIVEAVGTLRPGRGGEEPQLLVVADGPRGEAGLMGDLPDAEQGSVSGGIGHDSNLANLAACVKV